MGAPYLNVDDVHEIKITDTPTYGRTVSGYGGKIPTEYMLRLVGERPWKRVYAMCYGNAVSLYVLRHGKEFFLDYEIEPRDLLVHCGKVGEPK